MTRSEHIAKAEALLLYAESIAQESVPKAGALIAPYQHLTDTVHATLAAALVHATLAITAQE